MDEDDAGLAQEARGRSRCHQAQGYRKEGGEAERIDHLYHPVIFQMRTVYLDCKSIEVTGMIHLITRGMPRKFTSICAFFMQKITDEKDSGSWLCRQGITN